MSSAASLVAPPAVRAVDRSAAPAAQTNPPGMRGLAHGFFDAAGAWPEFDRGPHWHKKCPMIDLASKREV